MAGVIDVGMVGSPVVLSEEEENVFGKLGFGGGLTEESMNILGLRSSGEGG
jgi:hypothetical protein